MTHIETDVVVLGVGAMGSATLWRLSERGVRCVGFERFEPGHDRGSSHGESRIFRTAYLEGAEYVPLARRAVSLWHELDRLSEDSLIVQNSSLTLGPLESPVIQGTMESIRVHNLPHRLLDIDEVRTRFPAHRVDPEEVAIQEGEAGLVRPELAIRAAVRRAEELGAQVISSTVVDRVEPRGNGVRVFAGDITCDARHAVVSVGAWLGGLLPDLQLPVRVSRQVLSWFPVQNAAQFAPERFPVFLRDINAVQTADGSVTTDSSFYGFPTLDGRTVKLSVHREGPTADPDALDRTVVPADLELVQSFIRRFLRDVDPNPERTAVCMYTNTPDHDFLIGSPPGLPQITILGGFSGHGFKFAPVIGEVAADLAVEGRTAHPIDWMTPDRFGTRESDASL